MVRLQNLLLTACCLGWAFGPTLPAMAEEPATASQAQKPASAAAPRVGGQPAGRRNAAPVDFVKQVLPLLRRSCWECHGPEKQEGGLRLDQRSAALKGGDSGPAIVAGAPETSELLRRIVLPKGDAEIMPARGAPLAAAEVDLVRRWIRQGAAWPEQIALQPHWSYVAPVRPKLPKVENPNWCQSPLDYFVLARLEEEELSPSPPAEPGQLLRRMSLDLIGLPPAPADVEEFRRHWTSAGTDRSKRQKVVAHWVDRLLESPQFGVRWARPWLDLARYADSHGFQRDDLREIWPYRDWVVSALNSDMPFDQFTIEQVAGDLLPQATESQRIATGFHRATPTNVEAGSDPEETRINQVIDRVNTTGAVWLGTTLECAQCHNHKYDPITQGDYYRLLAFLNNTEMEADRSNPKVPGSIRFLGPKLSLGETSSPRQPQAEQELAEVTERLEQRRRQLAKQVESLTQEAFAALVPVAPQTGTSSSATANVPPTSTAPTTTAPTTTPPEMQGLKLVDFESEAGAPHKQLDDGSVLLVDDAPETDTYTLTFDTPLTQIAGLRLDCLTDDSLPGRGPGRGDAQRPNFVLHDFRLSVQPLPLSAAESKPQRVQFSRAQASFSQAKYDVALAVDDQDDTAWAIAPKFHQDHWAQFYGERPFGFNGGTRLIVTVVQHYGGGRTIGRLKISALTGAPPETAAAAPSVSEALLQAIKTPPAKRTAAQRRELTEYLLQQDAEARGLLDKQAELTSKRKTPAQVTTLVMQELPQPRMSTLFQRGDFRNPGDAVAPGVPSLWHSLPADAPLNRLGLARWLVDRRNPLVARVTVNRWWAEMFGRGIVSTVEDFGIKGELPTHPELLDWLAVEFMDGGWSMKRMLRTIVLSATYQQDSRLSPTLLERDDQNRFLARGPRFRLDAEGIRDNALSISGLLYLAEGGPPIRPYQPDGLWTKIGGDKVDYIVSPGQEKYRRGLYVVWKRGAPYPSFVNFDATARLACTVKRSRSNTPLQALTLLNDPVYVEAAWALARRILTDAPKPPSSAAPAVESNRAAVDAQAAARIDFAFRLCVARQPSAAEAGIVARLYQAQLEASQGDSTSTQKLLSGQKLPDGATAAEYAAWQAVAMALLNLDETITKN